MARVDIRRVEKFFGSAQIIRGVDIAIEDGQFAVLVGPSGCGKSTLLRMIAGLEEISQGEIAIDGRVVNALTPKERDIAMVFQNYALYPHMTVRDNMAFSLTLAKQSKAQVDERVRRAADILGLETLLASALRWDAASCATRRSSSSTSRCPTSMRSCACRCARRSRSCTSACRPPPST
jgi:multiple sugar transport system ATP-binding protein